MQTILLNVALVILVGALTMSLGCDKGGSKGPKPKRIVKAPPAASTPKSASGAPQQGQSQELVLKVDGQDVELPLERLNVWLTDVPDKDKAQHPETFDFEGADVFLAGVIPPELSVGYESAFGKLVGKTLKVLPKGGEHGRERESRLKLPGLGECKVLEGSVVIERCGKSFNARTPMEGKITIKVKTQSGEKTVEGTFHVDGTTWG